MMNEIIEIIKGWNAFGQFLFFFGTAFIILILLVSLIGYVGAFFTETLPILFRGYPPNQQESAEEDND